MTHWTNNFDPDAATGDGDYNERFKFEQPGDRLTGLVTADRQVTSDYGTSPVISVLQADGTEVDTFVSQAQLRRKLGYDSRPDGATLEGCRIDVTFTGTEDLGSGRTLKQFAVTITAPEPVNPTAKGAAPVTPDVEAF